LALAVSNLYPSRQFDAPEHYTINQEIKNQVKTDIDHYNNVLKNFWSIITINRAKS
jgi:hypothetical protein